MTHTNALVITLIILTFDFDPNEISRPNGNAAISVIANSKHVYKRPSERSLIT